MIYNIMRGATVVAAIQPEGTIKEIVNGEHSANLTFSLPVYVDFYKGDAVTIHGQSFILDRSADWEKIAERQFNYTLNFVSTSYRLLEIAFLTYGDNNELNDSSVPLMANAEAVLDLLILNANRIDSGWAKGVIDETDTVQHDFSEDNCRGVLTKLADTYKTEFWFEGKTIHFTKKGNASGLSFRYGQGNGLTSLTRTVQNKQVVTRLYVKGSDKNLPANYSGGFLRMPDNQLFIEDPVKVTRYGRIEGFFTADIFPKREGAITAVTDAFTFSDIGLDFDVNTQLIAGVSAKVSFISGALAGWDFELTSYNHSTKTFKILRNKDEKAIEVPSETGLKPAVGDKYVLIDIIMPPTYVTAAETALLAAGEEEYNSISDEAVNYTAPTFSKYLKDNGITVNLGDYVNIAEQNPPIDKNIRVISKTTNIQDAHDITLELADTVAIANVVRERIAAKAIQRAINANQLSDINRTRQNRKTQAEVINMVFNPETGQFLNNKLDVDWLTAQLITVGSKAGDFILLTTFVPNYQANVNKLGWLAGRLAHNELTDYQSGIWNFAAGTVSSLDPAKAYYIYAYCPFGSSTATIQVSDIVRAVDSIANQYTFTIGILSSVIDGYRTVSNTRGKTVINGGEIQTGLIKNQSGQSVLDLDARTFFGSFKFSNGDDVKTVTDTIASVAGTASVNAGNALANAAAAQTTANNATTAAATANATLADIANDNILSPAEKQATLKELQAIQGERGTIIAQAQTYGIAYTTFDNNYNTLNGYLTPLLSNLTTNSTIVGTTFRSNFKNYYDKRAELLKLISDAAKTLSDNIQIGGKNLLRKSIEQGNWSNDGSSITSWNSDYIQFTQNGSGVRSYMYRFYGTFITEPMVVGNPYTISFEYFIPESSSYNIAKTGFNNQSSANLQIIKNKWVKGVLIVPSFPVSVGTAVISFEINNGVIGDIFRVRKIKLERGNRATDYTLAPEDVDAAILAADTKAQNALTNANEAKNFINNVLPGDLLALQNQIDGLIETWFFDYVPTLANVPAVNWTTNTLKDKHLKDLFYNNVDGKGYRFSKNGAVYEWVLLSDTDTAAALALAQQAKDTADGKRRVFVATPYTPYDAGDLWAQGAGGDLMRCTTSRLTGAYNAADWGKANKYTDDTVAISAQQSADDAYYLAENAIYDASVVDFKVNDIANDNKLTPSEKQDILKDWQIIQGEKPTIIASAQTYNISYTAFESAYNTLSGYLSPLLANITTTSDIVGQTLRDRFKAYNDAKVDLLKLVSDAAKGLVEDIQVGGRNLLAKSSELTSVASGDWDYVNLAALAKNQDYVFSIDQSQLIAGTASIYTVLILDLVAGIPLTSTVFNISTTRQSLAFSTPATGDYSLLLYTGVAGATSGKTIKFTRLQLEKGNKATDWTPSPEDVEAHARELVNNIQIGGRNLLRNSYDWVESDSYPLMSYALTESLSNGEEVTLSYKGFLAAGKTMYIYNSGGAVEITFLSEADKINGVYRKTFNWVVGSSANTSLYLYPGPAGSGDSAVYEIKLERGNKATDWSQAPEEITEKIANIQELADEASLEAQNATATAENVALKTDFLTTTIDDNVVATGTLIVGDAAGNNNAGISGVVNATPASSVRFWAGATYANRNTAPFRVQQDGKVYMKNAVIEGDLNAGTIGGLTIANNQIKSSYQSGNRLSELLISNNGVPYISLKKWNTSNPNVMLTMGGVEIGDNYINVTDLTLDGAFAVSIREDSGNLGSSATVLLTGNATLYSTPVNGQQQTVKNITGGQLTLSAGSGKTIGLGTSNVASIAVNAGAVFIFQYYQPSNVWHLIK